MKCYYLLINQVSFHKTAIYFHNSINFVITYWFYKLKRCPKNNAENSYQMLRLVQIEKWRQAVSVFDFYSFTILLYFQKRRAVSLKLWLVNIIQILIQILLNKKDADQILIEKLMQRSLNNRSCETTIIILD